MTPRNLRNNNPCNIRLGTSHWNGQARVQTDPAFVVFDSMAMGFRAAFKLLESYRNRFIISHKPWTIRSIIERWAPPNENATTAYIQRVVQMTGISADKLLLLPEINGKDVVKIVKAMTAIEGGIEQERVPMDDLLEGYKKAFPRGYLP